MNEQARAISDAVRGVLTSGTRPTDQQEPRLDREAWDRLADLDFTAITASEEIGGAGGALSDGAAVVLEAALSSLCVAEAAFLAGPMLSDAELAWPGGVTSAAVGRHLRLGLRGSTASLHGTVSGVAWGRELDYLALLLVDDDGPCVVVVAPQELDGAQLQLSRGANIAGEGRDTLTFTDADVVVWGRLHGPWSLSLGDHLLATAAATQMAAAARTALEMSVRHTAERVQFGRSLDRFQAVQHRLADLAGSVVEVEVAAQAAVLALEHELADESSRPGSGRNASATPLSVHTRLLVASAKSEASSLAGSVAAAAHQLHGAIGFTREHLLSQATTRLWALRDEHGNERAWDERLADLMVETGRDPWPLITATSLTTTDGQRQ